MEAQSSSASPMNWPGPPLPAGYPWPAAPAISPMAPPHVGGMRPPMMFGPPPAASFPPGSFQQPPRLPFGSVPENTGDDGREVGTNGDAGKLEGCGEDVAENSLMADGDSGIPSVAHMGHFPRPMGPGDWRMRGPVPFGRMPRPDMMRGPRPLLGEGPAPPRFLGPPPRIRLNVPNQEEDEEYNEGQEEQYVEEYDEENEEEYYDENYDEEQTEEYPFDGNNRY